MSKEERLHKRGMVYVISKHIVLCADDAFCEHGRPVGASIDLDLTYIEHYHQHVKDGNFGTILKHCVSCTDELCEIDHFALLD